MKTDLLDQSASGALSMLIKEQLKNSKGNLRLINKQESPEALHDFRVSLRRLRIWLKVVRQVPAFALSKKDRKIIKHLVQLTNEARDLEVRLALLRQHLASGDQSDKAALELQDRWRRRISKDYERLLSSATDELKKVEPSIGELTSKLRKKRQPALPSTFKAWLIPVLSTYAQRTDSALFKIESIEDKLQFHEARLLAKALRYLVEPLANELAGSEKLLTLLRRLQDLIGGLRDAQMLAVDLDKAIQKLESQTKVRALQKARARNAKEIRYLYGELKNNFLRAPAPYFQDKVERLFLLAKK